MSLVFTMPLHQINATIPRYPIVSWRYRVPVYSKGSNSGSPLFIALRAILDETSPVT